MILSLKNSEFFNFFFHQRNLKKAVKMDSVDSSSGVLLPFYDHDTRIVFLAGKVCLKIYPAQCLQYNFNLVTTFV